MPLFCSKIVEKFPKNPCLGPRAEPAVQAAATSISLKQSSAVEREAREARAEMTRTCLIVLRLRVRMGLPPPSGRLYSQPGENR